KKPDQRYPSCCAFLEALAQAVAPPPPPRHGRRPVGLLVCLACLLVGTLAVLGWVLMHQGTVPITSAPMVDWQPDGWEPKSVAGAEELVADCQGKKYHRRLVREVHGQEVVILAIPQEDPDDPPTFYIMENKVWNGLFTAFTDLEKAKCEALFTKYADS